MPDLRTVLTETLRQHAVQTSVHKVWCSCGNWEGRKGHAEHVADVLLGLPGVVVTQLPDGDVDPEWGDVSWPVPLTTEKRAGKLRIDPDWRAGPRIASVGIPTPIAVADAPGFAAALLAAALSVEGNIK